MIVAGVMSGTSADGIDVAIVEILGHGEHSRFDLLGHEHFVYPRMVQQLVLASMNAERASVANLSRLSFLLAELYAEAVAKAARTASKGKLDLVGCHGQTLYHQGEPAPFLGRKIACTWQSGEGAVVASRLGVPVVSDFRPADMAAGGKGAPLVPFLDYLVFRDRRDGRIVQNLGGIANLTAIPAAAAPTDVLAFDTGPGNMVIDQLAELLFHKPYDRDGAIAEAGIVLQPLLEDLLRAPYFRRQPPKTAGREQFGREYARTLVRSRRGASRADLISTVTALTAHSIARAVKRFVLPGAKYRDYIVSGGGSRNKTLMRMLEGEISRLGLRLQLTDDFGIPSQAKEALAFAVLAHQTWRRRPGSIPSATGARRPAVLGKISYA
ncbi:MAG TPA: anhydro-N-acetylmuramic acid kinase [Terriglobales bacterium]